MHTNQFRRLLFMVGVPLTIRLCASAATIDWPQLKFTEVASGASVPTSIAAAPDGSGRLFVTEQNGRVLLVQSNSVLPFLDLQDRVQYLAGTESGLLSVAFPPGF